MCHNYKMICGEIDKALEKAGTIDSIAFDTWGVDYGLLDKNGHLIKSPVHYRDTRTDSAPEKVFEKILPKELYEETGNQIMPINCFSLPVRKKAMQINCCLCLIYSHIIFAKRLFAKRQLLPHLRYLI